jgi:hypothetical protein
MPRNLVSCERPGKMDQTSADDAILSVLSIA